MDLTTLFLFIIGFVFLVVGADLLVRGACNLAEALGISPLVVGLTIVAFGTSAPELAINIQSALANEPDLAVGNVVGSNILNVLLILGLAAIIAPLGISQRLIQLDVPLMIAASFLLLLLAIDGELNRWDGLIFLIGIVLYTIFSVRKGRQKTVQHPPVGEEYVEQLEQKMQRSRYAFIFEILLILIGLGLLVQGSQWLVDGAVVVAKVMGVSELIIGLTIIAIGTSLPEIATIVVASIRQQHELVVGNVVGSNLLNILLVLGVASFITPNGIEVSRSALVFDIPVMIAVSVACLPIFFTDYLMERWEGGLFLAYYVVYALYLFLNATQHSLLPAFSLVMLWFVIPITVATLGVFVWQAVQKHRKS